jgi:putative phage-type endonuclease
MREPTIKNISTDRGSWLLHKANTIGSSEIAILLGLNKYKTPLELWAEKTGRKLPDPENDYMWFGTQLEPVVGALFERKTGKRVARPDAMWTAEDDKRLTATPDFFTCEDDASNGILECKTSSVVWDGDRPPFHAHMQLQWQLGILGLKKGYLAALCAGRVNDFKHYECDFSPEIFNVCKDIALQFLDGNIKKNIAPGASAPDKELLHMLSGIDAGKEIVIDNTDLVDKHAKAKTKRLKLEALCKERKKLEDTYAAQIMQAMGDASIARTESGVIFKRTKVNVKAKVVEAYSFVKFSRSDKGATENE